jgi:hypothetical protein
MSSMAYSMHFTGSLLTHGPGRPRLLHDFIDESPDGIGALVASGDCFITLATTLDEIVESLGSGNNIARPQLEKLTRTLLYLQRHYKITRKTPDYRQ